VTVPNKIPGQAEVIQETVHGACLNNPPGTVDPQVWFILHDGCTTCGHHGYAKACETWGCLGPAVWTEPKGQRRMCGCD
jgi:hypothetical protein